MAELSWTEAQWQKINDAVTEAFGKASVATAFLPCYGPLAGGTETVRNERLSEKDGTTTINLDADHDAANLKLVNLTVKVELSSEQVADETIANALLAFRRAANILAQEEDRIVFDGYKRGGKDSRFVANALDPQQGLADALARLDFVSLVDRRGPSVVTAVVKAIEKLEDTSNPGPFACILGNKLFEAVHEPTSSMVLPADRITPIVKGPLLRSGKMDEHTGIVVSLSANAVDIVVGNPPTVQFLQRTEEGRFLFRVYERFVLRLRDIVRPPVAGFKFPSADSLKQGITGANIGVDNAEKALSQAIDVLQEAAVADERRQYSRVRGGKEDA